jgi:hypothetical protein
LEGELHEESFEGRLPLDAECGIEPVRFERLGQLPNDLDIAPGLPTGEPVRAGR